MADASAATGGCPAVFPPGSLTADGANATWVGAPVCIDPETGLPACSDDGVTPCPLDDGKCFPQFYDCFQMYQYNFKDGYDAWESTMFFLTLLALAYGAHKMYVVWKYPSASVAAGRKKDGLWSDTKLQLLAMNTVATFLRVLWLLNAHSNYGWTGLVWPNVVRAFVMKTPQMLWTAAILRLIMFWRDLVQKCEQMRRELKQTKLRKIVFASSFILFGICLPCELVARSGLLKPSQTVFLDLTSNSIFLLYNITMTAFGVVAAVRLSKILNNFQRQSVRADGISMRAQIRNIWITDMWLTAASVAMQASGVYNMFQQHRPYMQLTFWTGISIGELGYSLAFSYGLQENAKEVAKKKGEARGGLAPTQRSVGNHGGSTLASQPTSSVNLADEGRDGEDGWTGGGPRVVVRGNVVVPASTLVASVIAPSNMTSAKSSAMSSAVSSARSSAVVPV